MIESGNLVTVFQKILYSVSMPGYGQGSQNTWPGLRGGQQHVVTLTLATPSPSGASETRGLGMLRTLRLGGKMKWRRRTAMKGNTMERIAVESDNHGGKTNSNTSIISFKINNNNNKKTQ